MRKLLVTLAAFAMLCGLPQANAQTVTTPSFGDDSYVHVPLQFGFPFYGRTFTNSWMHSNGVVSFLDPAVNSTAGSWAYCCEGVNLSNSVSPQFSFMIAPLWTDLYPVGSSSFRTEGTAQYQKYFWNNIAEISNMNNLNSFSVEIRPTGFIGVDYSRVNIQNQNTTAGIIGDASLGQKQQFYFGRGIPNGALTNWSVNETLADPCTTNPLSSPSCPGYTQAMCTTNPLFSSTCPGYTEAMCTTNQLFSTSCSGYAQAYLDLQCSLNPLYSTVCSGYEVAYFNQQCNANPLYDQACSGYADAYYVQQCNANPLYDSGCNGYAQAYFDQQCSLDGLYDRTCPNYAQAYAANMLLNPPVVSTPIVIVAQVNEVTPALVSDPVVNQTLTTTSTSAAPAATATTIVPLAPAPAKTETKVETKVESSASTSSSSSEKKDEPKSTRQQLAERRLEAARAKAVEQGKNLANDMGNAASLEQQVALQNVVMQAMGFTAGFDAYNQRTIQDTPFYKPFEIYRGNNNIDAPSSRRLFGGSDLKHEQLVDQQYNLGQ
jgi:hypothetical protein